MTILTPRVLAACGILAASALPAAAQSGLCGGVGANGQWIGGSEDASDVSSANTYMEQMALVLMRNEYVALFSVSSPTTVRVEAQGRGGGDPVIDLRDEAGNIILSDDDSGGDTASRGEMSLQPGTYCLSMKSYDGSPMTGFVRVGRTEHEALTVGTGAPPPETPPETPPATPPATPPETPPTTPPPVVVSGDPQPRGEVCDISRVANFFGDGGAVDGSLENGTSVTASVDQVAYWGFSLAEAQALTITASNEEADPVIVVYDSNGTEVGYNDDFDGLNSRIDFTTPLPAGEYCIAMDVFNDPTLPVEVMLTAFDPAAAQIEGYERGEAAPPLDGSYPVTDLGDLSTRLRTDVQTTSANTWFSFNVPQGGLVLIEAVSNGAGDPIIFLYDDFGRFVAENDDANGTLDSMIATRVLPGTYLLGVRQLVDGESGLVRMLFERYVPAQ